MSKIKNTTCTFLLGAAAGAVTAMYLSSEQGKKSIENLKDKVNDMEHELADLVEDGLEHLKSKLKNKA